MTIERTPLKRFFGARPEREAQNALVDATREALSLTGSDGLHVHVGPMGRLIALARDESILARITGGSNPYTWNYVLRNTSGGWVDVGPGGGNAWHCNGSPSIPSGKIVELIPGYQGDFTFQLHRCCGTTGPTCQPWACFCDPMPPVIAFTGNYHTIFGPPCRDPTCLGCPTSTTLTVATRPTNFQNSSIVSNNIVWLSPTFTFSYYTYDQSTGNYDILNTTTGAQIILWCQPQNGQVTCQIYDSANNYGAVNALLAQTGDVYTNILTCNPFRWSYNATTSAWTGNTNLTPDPTWDVGHPHACCPAQICVNVTGCRIPGIDGATVTIALSGGPSYSGTVGGGGSGQFCTPVGLDAGTWNVTVVPSDTTRYATRTQNVVVGTSSCGTITSPAAVALNSGYCCETCGGSSEIVNFTTLHFTSAVMGSVALTGTCASGQYSGSLSYAYPGDGTSCAAGTVTVSVLVTLVHTSLGTSTAKISYHVDGSGCPNDAGASIQTETITLGSCAVNPLVLSWAGAWGGALLGALSDTVTASE